MTLCNFADFKQATTISKLPWKRPGDILRFLQTILASAFYPKLSLPLKRTHTLQTLPLSIVSPHVSVADQN
jgi:hypothetical protein